MNCPHCHQDPTQVALAFDLADEHMRGLVESEGVPIDGIRYAPTEENQREVKTIAQASQAFRTAVEWLVRRGLAKVSSDGTGEFVELTP